eukprot:130882-Prymnesium_polylepis.2
MAMVTRIPSPPRQPVRLLAERNIRTQRQVEAAHCGRGAGMPQCTASAGKRGNGNRAHRDALRSLRIDLGPPPKARRPHTVQPPMRRGRGGTAAMRRAGHAHT